LVGWGRTQPRLRLAEQPQPAASGDGAASVSPRRPRLAAGRHAPRCVAPGGPLGGPAERPGHVPEPWTASSVSLLGRVTQVPLPVSYWPPERIAFDQQPDDGVRHLGRVSKADRLAGEPLDPGPPRHLCPLDLLRVSLARLVRVGLEMPCLCAPIIGVI